MVIPHCGNLHANCNPQHICMHRTTAVTAAIKHDCDTRYTTAQLTINDKNGLKIAAYSLIYRSLSEATPIILKPISIF